MRRIRDQALVIERRDLGEADRLVVLLGRRLGKLSAVAPSGRRSRRRFGGCLELFTRIEVELVDRGRGGLWRLEEASLRDAHPGIRTDLVAVAHAGYLAELTGALLREGEEAGAAFDLLCRALERLDRGPLGALDLRRYELRLLALFGVAPQLDACLQCGSRQSPGWSFDLAGGGLVCADCRPGPHSLALPPGVRELLLQLSADGPLPEADAARGAAVRSLLARIIDEHAGRPLKAREFLRQLAEDASRGP